MTSMLVSQLRSGQSPPAVIVTCSDSRVGPEIIFDQGLGDIFVVRWELPWPLQSDCCGLDAVACLVLSQHVEASPAVDLPRPVSCPELLFVVGCDRVAGNVLDTNAMGSIIYAVEHLGSRLICVIGHSKCGACKAAQGAWVAKTAAGPKGATAPGTDPVTQLVGCILPSCDVVARNNDG